MLSRLLMDVLSIIWWVFREGYGYGMVFNTTFEKGKVDLKYHIVFCTNLIWKFVLWSHQMILLVIQYQRIQITLILNIIGQYDVKNILTILIKTIMSVVKVST
jgi:hypothetical protein